MNLSVSMRKDRFIFMVFLLSLDIIVYAFIVT